MMAIFSLWLEYGILQAFFSASGVHKFSNCSEAHPQLRTNPVISLPSQAVAKANGVCPGLGCFSRWRMTSSCF
jgi:hypothetical protein